jgi:hypothetical protein
LSQDLVALQMALAPCVIGYGAAANYLDANPQSRREGNRYWSWVEQYLAQDYTQAVRTFSGGHILLVVLGHLLDPPISVGLLTDCGICTGVLEEAAVLQSPSRTEELVRIFIRAIKVSHNAASSQ